MKKMKGVLAMESSSYGIYQHDPKVRLRHETLLQDYHDLQQETEGIKENLERVHQKRLTLSAEVSFLRQRYKLLMKNQPPFLRSKQNSMQAMNLIVPSRNAITQKNYKAREAALQPPVRRFNLNQKGRIGNGKKSTSRNHVLSLDINHNLRISNRNEATLPILDLNQNISSPIEANYTRKEAKKQKKTPIFDLNQISREEEELQVDSEAWRIEEAVKNSIRAANDEQQHNDMKLSVCRNVGTESNVAGKRKISWQDQVALRV